MRVATPAAALAPLPAQGPARTCYRAVPPPAGDTESLADDVAWNGIPLRVGGRGRAGESGGSDGLVLR
jgi:hypothetical protein